MLHLIIGIGNMGIRHGRILEQLGQTCIWSDINFEDCLTRIRRPDSVLICTPAETHLKVCDTITKNFGSDMPVFIEKPLMTPKQTLPAILPIVPEISHVGSNWRWCRHLRPRPREIFCQYQADKSHFLLDLVHFTDIWGPLKQKGHTRLRFLFNSPTSETQINETPHPASCGMFRDQMKYWLSVIENRRPPINPITKAYKTTQQIITFFNSPKYSIHDRFKSLIVYI